MQTLKLTGDQLAAKEAFVRFILDPDTPVFVLSGYAGTGKSTLVSHLLGELPATLSTMQLLMGNKVTWKTALTATTNKAAEALESFTQQEVRTIQSTLGLIVLKDYASGNSRLVPKSNAEPVAETILFIDEAGYIDPQLLRTILERTPGCKIIFIGDPAQLAPIKLNKTPVFSAGFPGAQLSEVVRQAEGNPIIDLATAFRNTVNNGEFFSFTPDGTAVKHVPRGEFEALILAEFQRPDWRHSDSKVLAWTNKTVIEYNHEIRRIIQGTPELQEGDYAVCNSYISNKHCTVKTDQLVCITRIAPASDYDSEGWTVELDHQHTAFLPRHQHEKLALIKSFKAAKAWSKVKHIEDNWIDLRAAYACTVNKSQGSTYKIVFIDLDDIKKCNNANTIARMLYVAVSRASDQVIFTGDLV